MDDETIDRAAQTLAECMDYPWVHMPEQGRESMRKHARSIVASAVAAERERCADPLPAAKVQKIKDVCDSLGLDAVAFAWRIQGACALRDA